MASEVRSGSSNFSYTNNTGQNVRIVINFMAKTPDITAQKSIIKTPITLSWAGASYTSSMQAIGRNLATSYINITLPPVTPFRGYDSVVGGGLVAASWSFPAVVSSNNGLADTTITDIPYESVLLNSTQTGKKIEGSGALPTEIMLAPGQTFSAICGVYNIVIIPEAG